MSAQGLAAYTEVPCGNLCACAGHIPNWRGFPRVEGHSVARMFSQFRRSRSRILVTWDKVRVPAGEDILVLAVGLARDKPLTLRNPISKNYSRVVSIAAHLQNLRPGDYINLPVARLGEILGVNDR